LKDYTVAAQREKNKRREEEERLKYNLVLALLAGCYVNNCRGYLVEYRYDKHLY